MDIAGISLTLVQHAVIIASLLDPFKNNYFVFKIKLEIRAVEGHVPRS